VIFVGGTAFADFETRLRNGGSPMGLQVADSETVNSDPKVYIVQLKTPAAAAFHASSAPRVAAKPSAGTLQSVPRFDKTSAAVQSHVQRLENEQAAVIAKAGPGVEQIYSYRYSLNGFAARMTPAEAAKLEHMPEVLRIWPDEIRQLATNHSANFLDLFNANTGTAALLPSMWHFRTLNRWTVQVAAGAPGPTHHYSADGCAKTTTAPTTYLHLNLRKTGTAFVKPGRNLQRTTATTK
jgi:hypothetical protein